MTDEAQPSQELPEQLAAGDSPPAVVSGELITSAWGNLVVQDLWRLRHEMHAPFTHTGINLSAPAGGVYNLGNTTLGTVAWNTRTTVWANFAFGFGGANLKYTIDILKGDGSVAKSSQGPLIVETAGTWGMATLSVSWTNTPGTQIGFLTRVTTVTAGDQYVNASGVYHIQRYGTP